LEKLNTQPPAVTSYVNAIGLSEGYYQQALHWFESSAFSVTVLCTHWAEWLSHHPNVYRLKGQRVYVGDGIKVAKEGRQMPGVKRLHQESEDVSKPEWIRGHYFNALGVLLGAGTACFAVPLILRLHDGITPTNPTPEEPKSTLPKTTLVTKMADLCVTYAAVGSYLVLDAYFACEPVLTQFRRHPLHLISRVRCSTVPTVKGRGRPRQWGSKVKLQLLFAPREHCQQAQVWLYGQWAHFPRWFRTLPQHGYPSQRIVQLSLQHQAQRIFAKSPHTLLLPKFLTAKLDALQSPDTPSLPA
jgi:hypothetical protein